MTELEVIKSQWVNCKRCDLCNEGRKQVVFSDGPETARIMIVGEGPGAIEDDKGIPFSGPAGMLMNKILGSVNINRMDCYWTNTVRCRPMNNRTPKVSEMNTCKPLLVEEIRLIKPKVIIIVGKPAAETLIGLKGAIGAVAGKWTEVMGIPAIIIYHPAAILHTQNLNQELAEKYKRSIWNSMKSLRSFLDEQEEVIPEVKNKLSFEEQIELL